MKHLLRAAMLMSCAALSPWFMASEAMAQVVAQQKTRLLAPQATAEFLLNNQNKMIWNDAQVASLHTALQGLTDHGLTAADYHFEVLGTLTATDRDRLATDAWFSAASHMLSGKLDADSVEPDWTAAKRSVNLQKLLSNAMETQTIANSLNALAPKQAGYDALKDEYKAVRLDAARPQTTVLPGDPLKLGISGPRVKLLQTRLSELGYLERTIFTDVMDEGTVVALKDFQSASDLDDDGVAGAATIRSLNRGLIEKMNQLRVNLERWRWLPDDLGRRHLRANIAGFNVTAWEDGVQQRSHLTIVGKPYRKTPVFSDKISYIVLNPWWETPRSLATRDKLPTFRKDPTAVERLGFQILDRDGSVVPASSIDWNAVSPSNFPYRIRQSPGPLNALGQVKIMFPNKHNVYLHDTPTRGLFSQRQRAFSSGCLRTEKPLDLSAWLLEGTPNWDIARINQVVATGKETRVNLNTKVDVHILYFTAVSEGDFGVRYLDDIYDRDAAVLAGLNATPQSR